jgi:integrase
VIIKRRDKNGDIRYGVRVSISGERRWLGTFPKLGEARKAEAEALVATRAPQSGPTCGEFARRWLSQDCPRLSGRKLKSDSIREYRQRLQCFINDFEDTPVTGISRERAFDWALDHRSSLQHVASLFHHAHDLGLIDRNPFEKLGLHKGRGRKDTPPPTEKQFETLLSACNVLGAYGPTFRAFLVFQAYTGLRPGETFALLWSDIEGDRVHVRRRRSRHGGVDLPKSNVERTVLLPPPARTALGSFPRGIDFVFRGARGAPLTHSPTSSVFRRVRDEAGLPKEIVLYSLRHMAAHHLYVKMGLPARVVAVQLGHNDGGALIETTYGHGDVGALEELEEAWANVG